MSLIGELLLASPSLTLCLSGVWPQRGEQEHQGRAYISRHILLITNPDYTCLDGSNIVKTDL